MPMPLRATLCLLLPVSFLSDGLSSLELAVSCANGTVILAVVAGVPNEQINTIGVWYTASRVAFSLLYSYIETPALSYLRSTAWWSGNISCIIALVQAGKKL